MQCDFCFAVVGPYLWTGSDDRTVRVWLIDSTVSPAVLVGHLSGITALCPTYTRVDTVLEPRLEGVRPCVWSASADGSVRAWDVLGAHPCIRMVIAPRGTGVTCLLPVGNESKCHVMSGMTLWWRICLCLCSLKGHSSQITRVVFRCTGSSVLRCA